MTDEEVEQIRGQIAELKHRHRNMDYLIETHEAQNPGDQFTAARLKKEKLRLKDMIMYLESLIIPDITA